MNDALALLHAVGDKQHFVDLATERGEKRVADCQARVLDAVDVGRLCGVRWRVHSFDSVGWGECIYARLARDSESIAEIVASDRHPMIVSNVRVKRRTGMLIDEGIE
ncbi:hypothetical protein IAG25_15255 [Caballeronia sp. EK]|uniref:hypothetical protein n=1 Tax=Caballeronia sp. EK TaxID=2767469 RepID=UPI001654FC53|nr:hypothetical protein [Caballeronia sp. EK]MBC8638178.1 hypothetical protein [Caballeronia sp. EK]